MDKRAQVDLKNINDFANIICDMQEEYYTQIVRTHAVLKEKIKEVVSPTHGLASASVEEIEAYAVALTNFITLNEAIFYIAEKTKESGRVQQAYREIKNIKEQLTKGE